MLRAKPTKFASKMPVSRPAFSGAAKSIKLLTAPLFLFTQHCKQCGFIYDIYAEVTCLCQF